MLGAILELTLSGSLLAVGLVAVWKRHPDRKAIALLGAVMASLSLGLAMTELGIMSGYVTGFGHAFFAIFSGYILWRIGTAIFFDERFGIGQGDGDTGDDGDGDGDGD